MDPKSLPKPTPQQVVSFMTQPMREIMAEYVGLMSRIAPRVRIEWAL